MRTDRSRVIYSELINGRFINKTMFRNGLLVPNPLFDELADENNREEYKALYENIGYELKQIGDSFFLNEVAVEERQLSNVAAHIQGLLVVLTRGITLEQLSTAIIVDAEAGLARMYIEKFSANEDFQRILKALGLRYALDKEVENVLIVRNIAYWNDRDNLVLTEAGEALLEHMLLFVSGEQDGVD